MEFAFVRGVRVVHVPTGLKGTVTAQMESRTNGGNRYGLRLDPDSKGRQPEDLWIDETDLASETDGAKGA